VTQAAFLISNTGDTDAAFQVRIEKLGSYAEGVSCCCIDNTDYYEYFYLSGEGNRRQGESWGLLNAPLIENGHIAPPDGPGWGAEWDETRFRSLVVAEV
jgi:hypothetical protein